jgi:creatinine amidohydrolase
MKLERLKTTDVAALSRETVVVVPVASIEQHGPHLPLGTDSLIGEGVVDALDAACGGRLLVLPVLRFGCSEHHMAFAGSLTLTHETFKHAVMEFLRSMFRHGFRKFLVLNSHGGNRAVGGVIAEQASFAWPEGQVVFASWFQAAAKALAPLVEGEFPSVGHACEFETSVMLLLHPDLVDMSKAQDDGVPPEAPQLRGDLLGGGTATLAIPFNKLTRRGVFGRPTLASAEKGRRVLDVTTAELRQMVRHVWGVEG